MENGFYRISLSNLQKIMHALGIGIQEVWPQPLQTMEPRAVSKPDLNTVNYFRFQEICSLTEARSGALVCRDRQGALQLLYGTNLRDDQMSNIERAIAGGRRRNWLIYEKSTDGIQMYLLLKGAAVEGRLGTIVELYLDLWLATQVATKTSPGSNGTPFTQHG